MSDLRRRLLLVGPLLVLAALLVLGFRGYALVKEHRTFYLLSLPAAPVHRPRERLAIAERIVRLLRFARVPAVVVRRDGPLVHLAEIVSIKAGIPVEFRSGPDGTILKNAVLPGRHRRLYIFLRRNVPAWLRAVPRPLRHPVLSLVVWSPLGGVRVYSLEPGLVMTAPRA